jgi:hypothetical protein
MFENIWVKILVETRQIFGGGENANYKTRANFTAQTVEHFFVTSPGILLVPLKFSTGKLLDVAFFHLVQVQYVANLILNLQLILFVQQGLDGTLYGLNTKR